jgi:hypothetical protein
VKYIAEKKKTSLSNSFPNIQYGGFAKTNKHFNYIKEILTIEAENGLSYIYKISSQTFDKDILDNIKRTDLRSSEHWELANYLRKKYYYDATVELILGLPGITLEKWFSEFNIPYNEYRLKHKIGTAKKTFSNNMWAEPAEIVVEGATFSRQDYIKMMEVYALYMFFAQSGCYKDSIEYYLKINNCEFGDFLEKFYFECYTDLKQQSNNSLSVLTNHFEKFVKDETNDCVLLIAWNNTDINIVIWSYLVLEYFKNFDSIDNTVKNWFIKSGVSKKLVELESDMILSESRIGTSKRRLLKKIKYNNYKNDQGLVKDLSGNLSMVFRTSLLIASQSFIF